MEEKKLANRVYELMYIAYPETTEEEISALNEGITKVLGDLGGSVVKIDNMGKRRLAYEIKHKKEGYYVLFEIEGSGSEIAEIERRMRVNDLIMRYITVRVDEDRKAAAKRMAKKEKSQNRRSKFKPNENTEESKTEDSAE